MAKKENLARRSPVSSLLNSSLSPCQPWRPPLRSSGRKYQPHLTCSRPFLSNTIPMIAATYGSASLLFNNAVSARGPSVRSRAAKQSGGQVWRRGGAAPPILYCTPPFVNRTPRLAAAAAAPRRLLMAQVRHWLRSFQTGRCSVPQLAVQVCCWNGAARGAPATGSTWPATASYCSPDTPCLRAQCPKPTPRRATCCHRERALSAFPTARCASWQRQKSSVWRGRVHQGVAFGAWELEPLNRCYAGRYKWGVLRQQSAA
eukprot:COSAG04_NODE_1389_length_6958_cov_12.573553_2_plen_259_part_00